jgi:hypothetical protein
MCECLEYDDGSMHLCACCAGIWRERQRDAEQDGKRIDELERDRDAARAEAERLRVELLVVQQHLPALLRRMAGLARKEGAIRTGRALDTAVNEWAAWIRAAAAKLLREGEGA